MRKHLRFGASASLALVLSVAACGGSATGSGAGSASGRGCPAAPHHAYVVVEHLSGRVLQRCVGFSGSTIDGDQLMRRSRIEYQTQTFSGLGKAVCQIDREPAHFSTCFPKGQPYWALYESRHGAPWVTPSTGYAALKLGDGDALGWRYVPASGSPAPPPPPPRGS
ncbi:MAG TPA: hypothetical protein VFD49_10885 [Candidatus Dormibacteraeota bacterium]|nr:hypothetical protein [Candidatus Dormibacteraeota bacterium]